MSVLQMPAIQTDANGLPRGHDAARDIAAKYLRDWINELPVAQLFLTLDDAEEVATVMLAAYLMALRREQR